MASPGVMGSSTRVSSRCAYQAAGTAAPVSASLLARAALRRRLKSRAPLPDDVVSPISALWVDQGREPESSDRVPDPAAAAQEGGQAPFLHEAPVTAEHTI